MPFIAFLGCDGSGKSAVISQLQQYLKSTNHSVITFHWRPQAIDIKRSASASSDNSNPHSKSPRSLITSILKLVWLWLNWQIAWTTRLKFYAKSNYILFDRYHVDILIDPDRYRYGGPKLLATFASRIMPQPDVVFYLDATPDVLLSRKQEISEEALLALRRKYLDFCKSNPRATIVDASLPLGSVISEIKLALSID